MSSTEPAPQAQASSSTQEHPTTQILPTEPTEHVAVDAYAGEGADSAYDSEVASYTTSLASSVTDYKFMHGRRYHSYKEGSYMFPNDEKEKDRLDIVHKVIESIRGGKLHYAPLQNPKRALDIGTGTGIWAMEFGDEYPQCDVLGNDLSPIQPRWVPPNVHFEIDDIEAEWTYSQKFDFINCRSMNNAIHDWPKLTRQAFKNLNPGGWVEFSDWDVTWTSPDGSLTEDSAMYKMNREFIKAVYDAGGADPCPGPKLEKWITDAGFEDIKVWKYPAPFGTWPADKRMKEVGAWNYLQVSEGLEGLIYYVYTKLLNLSKEETDVAAARFRSELRNPRIHPMCHYYVVIGKKPEGKSTEAEAAA